MARTLLIIVLAVVTVIVLTLVGRSPRSRVPQAGASATALAPAEVKDLFLAHGCVNCHDVQNVLVGPPFTAIAERYRSEPQAEQKLLASLRQGSQGRWGAEPMPVQRVGKIGDREAEAMIRWILGQGTASETEANGP